MLCGFVRSSHMNIVGWQLQCLDLFDDARLILQYLVKVAAAERDIMHC